MDEIVLENKMQGDHLGMPAEGRAVLRRQARQVQRMEDPAAAWEGEVPLWVAAPNVSAVLRKRRTVTKVAPGCYRVGPYPFTFLWIAANELPLRDELLPFLVARSGRALDAFCLWAKTRLPPAWLQRRVKILPMSTATAEELAEELVRYVRRFADDPEIRARQRWVTKLELKLDPELHEQVVGEGRKEGRDEGRKEGRDEGRVIEARSMLRRVLARRALSVGAKESARIDDCTDLATLERWVEQAVAATSAADALR
jgi:hypothetical protein